MAIKQHNIINTTLLLKRLYFINIK